MIARSRTAVDTSSRQYRNTVTDPLPRGVDAGGFGAVPSGFDGGQVAEDDAAAAVSCHGRVIEGGGQGFPGLGRYRALRTCSGP